MTVQNPHNAEPIELDLAHEPSMGVTADLPPVVKFAAGPGFPLTPEVARQLIEMGFPIAPMPGQRFETGPTGRRIEGS